jgi:hypothetical protein
MFLSLFFVIAQNSLPSDRNLKAYGKKFWRLIRSNLRDLAPLGAKRSCDDRPSGISKCVWRRRARMKPIVPLALTALTVEAAEMAGGRWRGRVGYRGGAGIDQVRASTHPTTKRLT